MNSRNCTADRCVRLIIAVVILCAVASTAALAEKRVQKGGGTLMSIDLSDKTVMIDNRGYEVASSALIFDIAGRRITLDKLVPPVPVTIEFDYTTRGALIKRLQVTPH